MENRREKASLETDLRGGAGAIIDDRMDNGCYELIERFAAKDRLQCTGAIDGVACERRGR